MATIIRLRRIGTINKPFYRLVVSDSRFSTTGRFLEILGWYDPKQADKNFSVNVDRVNYWLGTGARMSNTAKSLLKKAQAGEGVPPGSAPEKKQVDLQALLDRMPAKAEKPAAARGRKTPARAEAAAEPQAEATPETQEA